MNTRIKAFVFGAAALCGLLVAAPATAQIFNSSYYYPQQYAQPQYGQHYGSCPVLSYNLTIGSTDYRTGGQVSQLQSFLRSRYGDARLTGGYYGQLTTYYVSRFQSEQGVYPVTGGVGPLTRQAIARVCGGYTPNPNPGGTATTFRLDRDFSLNVGQTGELRNENLTITLTQIVTGQYGYYYNAQPQAARITVTEGCKPGTYCFYAPSQTFTLEDGDDADFRDWNIEVRDLDAREATFRVTENGDDNGNDDDDATIEVTRPTSSDDVDQGDTLRISWNSTDAPNNSSVVLDLYESDGDRVGTIAISDDEDGSYAWRVPERGAFCTQQFPNGLCGHDLDGSYYVRASLTEGSGFDGGDVLDADNSGTFDIDR
jgi:hypothetical protein